MSSPLEQQPSIPDTHHWQSWQGLSLAERSAGLPADLTAAIRSIARGVEIPGYDHEQGSLKLQRWRKETGLNNNHKLLQRLQPLQLDEYGLQFLLGETDSSLQTRMTDPLPRWQQTLTDIYNTAAPAADPDGFMALEPGEACSTADDFLEWLRPLVRDADRQLNQALCQHLNIARTQATALTALARPTLCLQFYRMSQRTLLLTLRQQRSNQALAGDTSQQRYQFFVRQLQQPQFALQLFAAFPVLARQLLTRCQQWITSYTEFFHRLHNDRQHLAAQFNQGHDLGELTQIDAGRGDRHADGRSVFVLHFSSGLRLVYKPKPLQVDSIFQHLLGWLNRAGFKPQLPQLNILDCGDYGWCEFIDHTSCSNRDEVARFYQRQGGYLALLYALEATDFHYENVIAHGATPYLIDLETLFQPHLQDSTSVGPGSRLAIATVLRCGMLPLFRLVHTDSSQVDLSGLGNSHGRPTRGAVLTDIGCDTLHLKTIATTMPAGANQPLLNGEPQRVQDYAEHVLSGFSQMYRLLMVQRETLLQDEGPLSWFRRCRLRYLIRGTELYVRLLHASYHPDYLQSGLMRDRLFDKLWLDYDFYPAVRPLIASEHNALARSDVPLFITRGDSTDLYDDRGNVFKDFFLCTGLEQSRRRLQQLDHDDLQRQYRLVNDCLRGMQPHPWDETLRPRHAATTLSNRDLLDCARHLAGRVRRQAIHHNGIVGWLQPSYQGGVGWVMAPCAVSLYDGLAGIALFYATLARLDDDPQSHADATLIWHTARRRIRDNPKALQCVGAYSGWGGMFYAAARLAPLGLPTPSKEETTLWYQRLRRDLPQDNNFDFIAGSSGAIMGLLRWYEYSGDDEALALAITCGDHLLQHAQAHSAGLAWACTAADNVALTGIGHGAAGIAQALHALGHSSAEPRFNQAAAAALRFENAWYSDTYNNWLDRRRDDLPEAQRYAMGWCHGAPGIGLSRLQLLAHNPQADLAANLETDLHHAVTATMNADWGHNQSLCHGDLGNLELIHRAAQTLSQPEWTEFCHQQLRWLVPLLRENRQRSGLQNDAEIYGMMNGLTGMGYALLRFAFPDQVASILTLD